MDWLQFEIVGGTVLIMASIGALAWWARRMHLRTHEKVDGVRVRLERHADEVEYNAEKDRAENKKLRTSIYRQFKEWLQHMRGPQ